MFGVPLLPDAMVRCSAGRRGDSDPEGAGGSVLKHTYQKHRFETNVPRRNSIRGHKLQQLITELHQLMSD